VFCIECGKEIPDTAKFCPDCGTPQIKKIEKAEEDLPFAEVESIEEDLPFAEVESIEEDTPFVKVEKVSEVEKANLVRKKSRFAILCWVTCFVSIMNFTIFSPAFFDVSFLLYLTISLVSLYCLLAFATKYFSLDREINRIDGMNLLYSTSEKAKIREISDSLNNLLILETLRKKRTRSLLFGAVHTIACFVYPNVLFVVGAENASFFLFALGGLGFIIPVIFAILSGERVVKLTYQIWKTSFLNWYNKKAESYANVLMEKKSYTIPNWTVMLTLVIVIFGFIILSTGSDDSDSPSSSLPPRGGDVELELRHSDPGYSELSYVVYFDDKEGPSGTLAYGENIWSTLCGNCEGSHTIEVYWGDGDDCQADIEVVGSSDEIWQCTNR